MWLAEIESLLLRYILLNLSHHVSLRFVQGLCKTNHLHLHGHHLFWRVISLRVARLDRRAQNFRLLFEHGFTILVDLSVSDLLLDFTLLHVLNCQVFMLVPESEVLLVVQQMPLLLCLRDEVHFVRLASNRSEMS